MLFSAWLNGGRHQEGIPQQLWELDAQNYVNDLPGLAAFDWIDETYRIRWSIPEIGRKNFIGFEADSNAQFKAYLDRVRETGRITFSGVYESNAGITAISFYVPLYVDSAFSGFMGGVLDVEKFVESQQRGYLNDIQIQFLNGEQELFSSLDSSLDASSNDSVSTAVRIGENEFLLTAAPTASFQEQYESPIPSIILGIGMAFAVLAALSMCQFKRMSMSRRKIAELDRSLERQTAALSLTSDAVFIQNIDGRISDCNEAAITMFGFSKQELTGMNAQALADPEFSYEKFSRDEQGQLSEEKSLRRVVVCRTKDGRRITTEIGLIPFKNDAEETIALISTVRDITKQEESKRRLDESEKRFRGLFSESVDGIVIRESAMSSALVEVNQAYLDIIGYERHEVEHLALDDLVKRPEGREQVRKAGEQLGTRGYSDDYNIEYCRKDGSFVPVNVRFWTLVNEDDGHKEFIGLVRDTSETQRAVTQMKEAQQLANVGSWAFDVGSRNFSWSEEPTRIHEIEKFAGEVTVEDFIDRVHPDDREKHLRFQNDSLIQKN